jgi:hypothetical protein
MYKKNLAKEVIAMRQELQTQAQLGGETQQGFYWFYHVVYDPDCVPERLYELPSPKLVKVEGLEDGRIIEVYQLSDKKGLIRDTYNNGNSAWIFIGVEALNDNKVWQTEYVFCLPVCDNDHFWFTDL